MSDVTSAALSRRALKHDILVGAAARARAEVLGAEVVERSGLGRDALGEREALGDEARAHVGLDGDGAARAGLEDDDGAARRSWPLFGCGSSAKLRCDLVYKGVARAIRRGEGSNSRARDLVVQRRRRAPDAA